MQRQLAALPVILTLISLALVVSNHQLLGADAVGPAATPSDQCVTNSVKPQPGNQTLSVSGTIDLTNSTVKLDPFMVLPGSKYTVRPANSSFSINLFDGNGRSLAHYPFDPKASLFLSQNKDKMALLSEAVPYLLCTKEIVISRDGMELASRHVDNYAPKVKMIYPVGGENITGNITVRWQGTDADGDNLTYFVLYSADDGRSWETVASGIKDTHLTVNTAGLPGSNNALFRIIATDGVNTGISDSASSFKVPSISITAG